MEELTDIVSPIKKDLWEKTISQVVDLCLTPLIPIGIILSLIALYDHEVKGKYQNLIGKIQVENSPLHSWTKPPEAVSNAQIDCQFLLRMRSINF